MEASRNGRQRKHSGRRAAGELNAVALATRLLGDPSPCGAGWCWTIERDDDTAAQLAIPLRTPATAWIHDTREAAVRACRVMDVGTPEGFEEFEHVIGRLAAERSAAPAPRGRRSRAHPAGCCQAPERRPDRRVRLDPPEIA